MQAEYTRVAGVGVEQATYGLSRAGMFLASSFNELRMAGYGNTASNALHGASRQPQALGRTWLLPTIVKCQRKELDAYQKRNRPIQSSYFVSNS